MSTIEVILQGDALGAASKVVSSQEWQDWFETWLSVLGPELSPIGAYELSLQMVMDPAIAALNAQYRSRFQATDVLAFAAMDDNPLPVEVLRQIPFGLGDLVVSVEAAQRQCIVHGHTLREELAWLSCHGLLHLLGWDHPDEAHLHRMLAMQQKLLLEIGLALEDSGYSFREVRTPALPGLFKHPPRNKYSDF